MSGGSVSVRSDNKAAEKHGSGGELLMTVCSFGLAEN